MLTSIKEDSDIRYPLFRTIYAVSVFHSVMRKYRMLSKSTNGVILIGECLNAN